MSVVGFTESVLEKLLKLYQFSMDADFKVNLLKVMHISIVVHSPEPNSFERSSNDVSDQSDDLFKSNVAEDAKLWHKHLRNMLSIVEREITDQRKRSLRSNPIPNICPIFVQMAAKLCSVVSTLMSFFLCIIEFILNEHLISRYIGKKRFGTAPTTSNNRNVADNQ